MRRFAILGLFGLVLMLAACGKDPVAAAQDKLAAHDLTGARQVLEAAVTADADKPAPHFYLFVLYRYELTQSDPTKQDALMKQLIREYEWLAKYGGVSTNYADMEASLNANNTTRDMYHKAREAVFGSR